jgi:hypothetical protein
MPDLPGNIDAFVQCVVKSFTNSLPDACLSVGRAGFHLNLIYLN